MMAGTDSVKTAQPGGWHEIDGISEPIGGTQTYGPAAEQHVATSHTKSQSAAVQIQNKPKKEYTVPTYLAWPRPVAVRTEIAGETVTAADSLATDTVAIVITPEEQARLDSIAREEAGSRLIPIVLENPSRIAVTEIAAPEPPAAKDPGVGMSWVYLVLALLFCVAALRFKNSRKQIGHLFNDLTDTRLRHNMFDDTVKETSFVGLLNVLWAASAGVMLWKFLWYSAEKGAELGWSYGLQRPQAAGIGICAGLAGLYLIGLLCAYWAVGRIFTDQRRTQLWIKGATSSTALETFILFPVALLLLSYPSWTGTLLIIGGSAFLIGKLLFFSKGFRIFFNQLSSLLLFLYYLCSLEIVPIVLVCLAAMALC